MSQQTPGTLIMGALFAPLKGENFTGTISKQLDKGAEGVLVQKGKNLFSPCPIPMRETPKAQPITGKLSQEEINPLCCRYHREAQVNVYERNCFHI